MQLPLWPKMSTMNNISEPNARFLIEAPQKGATLRRSLSQRVCRGVPTTASTGQPSQPKTEE